MNCKIKRLLTLAISLAVISSALFIGVFVNHMNKRDIVVGLIENQVSAQELWAMSDVVVKGEISSKIDEFDYEGDTLNSVYSLYNFTVSEEYFGLEDTDSIIIAYAGTKLPDGLEMNEQYIIYLVRNSLNYDGNNVYSFVSLSQGVYRNENGWKNDVGEEFVEAG